MNDTFSPTGERTATMERLGRYPLSVILSFLSETEGTSLLLTKRRFAHHILPNFRLKPSKAQALFLLDKVTTNQQSIGRNAKHRHQFIVSPVQDPSVLLERLNTKRLFRRKEPVRDFTTVQLAKFEWGKEEALEQNHLTQETPSKISRRPSELELLRFLHHAPNSSFATRPTHHAITTLLASYPRSGNTLLRSLLERVTGLVTGSDTRPNRNLSRELAERHNLVGEGVTQQCPFVKTHWPERSGNALFVSHRVVLVVRNPYDAMDSYWNMNATKSHTKSVTREVYQRFRHKFTLLIQNEIHVWLKFHQFWLQQQLLEGDPDTAIPVLVVRYEDLVHDTQNQLCRILAFSLGKPEDALSEYWRDRIRHVVSDSGVERLGSYRPRASEASLSNSSSDMDQSNVPSFVGKSLRKGIYSDDLLQYIHTTANQFGECHGTNYLRAFGYDMLQDNFPKSFLECPSPTAKLDSRQEQPGHRQINRPEYQWDVRPMDCPYGRAMTAWRHSVTNNDQNPLPIVT